MPFIHRLLVLGLTAAACSSGRPGNVDPNAPAAVEVDNRNFADMTIYVVRTGGDRLRLGLATGNSTRTFAIPNYVLSGGSQTLRFLADPVGSSEAPITEELTVLPGDTVTLTIQP